MEDAPKDDALPLLAFALQRLWHLYAATGALTREHYIKVGGLRGLIDDAAERALQGVEPGLDVPRGTMPRSAESLGAATFVPALVQINDKGEPIRRIAEWSDEDQRSLLTRFDRWRLVVRKGEAQGGTVEVAHEALFREWSRLKGWLEPERARLDALRSLEVDAGAWERNGRDRNYLNHRDRRLADTEALTTLAGFRPRITAAQTEYLADCREAENLAMRQRRRQQWSIRVLSVGAVLFLLLWLNKELVAARWYWLTDTLPYQQTHIRPHVLTAEREGALNPGDPIHECDQDCPEMVVVAAGRFTMGSPDGEAGRYDDEGPQHEVAVARFAVSKFTVTFADWDACAAHGDCDPKISDSNIGRGRQPVINVTWDDAKRYAAWLSDPRRNGNGLSLGRRYRPKPCQLRRLRQRMGREASRTGRFVPGQRFRSTRYGRQCVVVGGRLPSCLRQSLKGCRRDNNRGMQSAWPSRRFLVQQSAEPSLGHTRLGLLGVPGQRRRFPLGEDAYPLSLYLFTPGVQGRSPWSMFFRVLP
jgi:hypothetical protein